MCLMDDEPPGDFDSKVSKRTSEICMSKLEANLAESVKGIRGGESEPEHGCRGCDGHAVDCSGYHGIKKQPSASAERNYSGSFVQL